MIRHVAKSFYSRRSVLKCSAGAAALIAGCSKALAAPKKPSPPGAPLPSAPAQFSASYVVELARAMAGRAYDTSGLQVPDALRDLSEEGYRDLRFRPDHAFFADTNAPYRLQLFHLGYLYQRQVAINLVTNGISYAVPYAPDLFENAQNKFDPALPADLGYAGFRLHYPLNTPGVFDELVSFVGASNFRFLGREQRYGLNARGLAIDTGSPSGEEIPYFRSFWIETPGEGAKSVTVHALLDSPSLTGAYQFKITPGKNSEAEVRAILFARKSVKKIGLAPLASMFFYGEQQNRTIIDYRPEVHDSDGLLVHNGAGEWLWRPLRNPGQLAISDFVDNNVRGFGLLQRDRDFDHYQDLSAMSQARPSYWVEPLGSWGEGMVELIEIPTPDEANDNILAYWVPKNGLKQGESFAFSYRLQSMLSVTQGADHPGARVVATYQKKLFPHEAPEANEPGVRRFMVDFAGGDLEFYQKTPQAISAVVTATPGTVLRSYAEPNPHTKGFRVVFDVKAPANAVADLRASLRSGNEAISETWTMPWRHEG